MSFLVKGIDLPEAYGSAILAVYECIDGRAIPKLYDLSTMQMQTIPPHGPLIDMNEALHTFSELDPYRRAFEKMVLIEAEGENE